MTARWEVRVHKGRTQARFVSAPRAPWETDRVPIAGHGQWSENRDSSPGPWFDLPERDESAPFFDPRTAGSSEPLSRYEEHTSYDVKIELPLCGLCGGIAARCDHHVGYTLREGERFEDLTPARRSELIARAARWDTLLLAFERAVTMEKAS